MQSLFNRNDHRSFSLTRYAQWDTLRSQLQINIDSVIRYYSTRVQAVKSNHLLARILNSLNVPHSLPTERFFQLVSDIALSQSMVFQISSPLSQGRVHRGVFYGPNSSEILVYDSASADAVSSARDWKNIQAVRVVSHPRTDLDLLLPNGKDVSYEDGVSVIAIDIPLLALQFRQFSLEMASRDQTEVILGVTHFIHMYVLPNMLKTQTDITLVNRVAHLFHSKPMPRCKIHHPFRLIDIERQLNQMHQQIICDMQNKNMVIEQVFRTIPAVTSADGYDALQLPQQYCNRQIRWTEMVARIGYLVMAFEIMGRSSLHANLTELNHLVRLIKTIENEQGLIGFVPGSVYLQVKEQMDEILSLV